MKKHLIMIPVIILVLLADTILAHDRRADNQLDAAVELYRLGKFEEAIGKCKSSLSYGQRGDAHYLMARCFMQKEQYQEAVRCLEKAKECQSLPHSAEPDVVQFYFGHCHTHLDEVDKAIEDYRKALRIEPKKVEYLNALAAAYRKAGKVREAIEIEEEATLLLVKQNNK